MATPSLLVVALISLLLGCALAGCAEAADEPADPPAMSSTGSSPGVSPSSSDPGSSPRSSPATDPDASVVFDGDSLTAGYGLSGSESYPAQLMATLPDTIDWANVAVSGQVWPDLLADAETDVDPRHRDDRTVNVVVVWAAANDLTAGFTAQETYENARRYCEGRQQRDFRVVILTMYPLHPRDVDRRFEAARRAYNDLLRAGWRAFADALVDVAADDRIGDESTASRSAYFLDLVHLTPAGYAVIADCVRPALVGLLGR